MAHEAAATSNSSGCRPMTRMSESLRVRELLVDVTVAPGKAETHLARAGIRTIAFIPVAEFRTIPCRLPAVHRCPFAAKLNWGPSTVSLPALPQLGGPSGPLADRGRLV